MPTNKVKKYPQRMCIVCRQMVDKSQLLRIVKTSDNDFFIDRTGKANGRGAYVCNNAACMGTCLKKKTLNNAFKCNVPTEVYEKLAEEYAKQNS